MANKLIIYELNELPKKLLEAYIKIKPNSNISKLKNNGIYLETFTTDKGELHPWTTWSTFYRGVDNSEHKITSLNQDRECDKKYPPIWEVLIKNKLTIGIFGTLQSYPPLKDKRVKFYLPDTFSPNYDAYPKDLETFQKFNLKIVANNSGEVRKIRKIEIKYFVNCILNSSIRIKNLLKIIKQVLLEKLNKKFKKRRALLQPNLSFDIYFRNLQKAKPDFSTFFTNHLAGMMHYYWLDIFPDDFKNAYREPNKFNKKSVMKALDIADRQIGVLMEFASSNSYQLWVASSMGQGSIERSKSERIFLKNFTKLLHSLNLNKLLYKQLPSMYPDVNIESNSEKNLNDLIKKIMEIKFSSNEKSILQIRYRKNKNKVNLIFRSNLNKENFLTYKNKTINIKDFGLEYGELEQGTGYHIPEGILLMQGEKSKTIIKEKVKLDTKKIFSYVLKIFDIK